MTAFLNREDQSGLERCGLCSSELASIVADYQKSLNTNFNVNMKHHEDTDAFQKWFTLDVRKVVRSMVANPFQEDTLARIDNTTIQYDDKVLVYLKQFLDKGQEQAKQFCDERLVKGTVPIDAPVKKKNFSLPGKFEGRKKEEQKLTYSNSVLTKLRSAIDMRPEITKKVFQSELFGVAQSLTETSTKLYHGIKSTISQQFDTSEYINIDPTKPSAVVIELSPLIRTHSLKVEMTFVDFALSLFQRIVHLAKGYFRCDVIIDRYFEHSLKENLHCKRGVGSRNVFEDDTEVHFEFKDNFWMNSANKHDLGHYLAEKFSDFYSSNPSIPTLMCTHGNSILTNSAALQNQSDINNCISKQADQKILRHAINCAKNAFERVDVLTIDTDVLILVVAYFSHLKSKSSSVSVLCGTGFGTASINY